MMDWKRWAVIALVLAAGVVVFSHLLGGTATATVSATVSPSTVQSGGSVTLTGTVSNLSWTSPGYYCIDLSSTQTATWCGSSTGKCYTPCQHPDVAGAVGGYQVYKCASASGSAGCSLALYSGADPQYSVSSNSTYLGAVDYLLADSSSPTAYTGFLLAEGEQLKVDFSVSSYTDFSIVKPTVALCYTGTVRYVPPPGWTYYKTVSGTWYGATWTCEVYTLTSGTSSSSYWEVNGTSSDARFYISFASQCWYDSAQCPASTYTVSAKVTSVAPTGSYLGSGILFHVYDPDSVLSCSDEVLLSPSSSASTASVSFTCTASGTGSHTVGVEAFDYGVVYYHAYSTPTYIVPGAGADLGTGTTTLSIQAPATSVALYAYGSTTGVPSQTPTDHYVQFRVYVSGGTLFDSVKVYIDGTLKATYYPSDFVCGASSCYKDAKISMLGAADGSHTIKAELYVNGALQDSTSSTFDYYQVGVQSVSASQVGTTNQFTVSWQMKGGWYQYQVYIDTPTCVAQPWTGSGPSVAQSWTTYGPYTYNIPACAATSGTHTVYVEAKDASGTTASDSVQVTFNITHTYSVSLTSPVTSVKHLQTDQEGLMPSTYTETMTAEYNTDDPSAQLVFLVNGSQVQSWTVTGSGTQSYVVPASDLSCGQDTFTAELGPAGSPSVSDQATVTYYCWYINIGYPSNGSTVTLPSEDLTTVASGSYLDVYIKDSVTPSDRVYAVYATLDGASGSPITCPAGYTHCFRFDVSGAECNSVHTIQAWIDEAGTTRATTTSTVAFQCAQNFVRIDSPVDGQELDYKVPLGDVNVVLAITYAGGSSLSIYLNGRQISPPETNNCSSTVCYVLTSADGLHLGDNDVNVYLYDGNTLVAQDSATFGVYSWVYVPGEVWDQTPPLLVLRENGSHADACTLTVDGNTHYMSYDSSNSWWYYPISDAWKGKDVNFECQFHSRVVWTGSYRVQGQTTQPSAPVIIGGGGTVTAPISKPAFPVFPNKVQVSHYIYSVYYFAGLQPTDVFRDVYVSQDRLCFVPKAGKHTITYYAYNFSTWPTSDNEVKQILGNLSPKDIKQVSISHEGSAYCIPLSGTAVIKDTVTGPVNGTYYFLVLDTAQAVSPINITFVLVIALVLGLLAWMVWGGKLG